MGSHHTKVCGIYHTSHLINYMSVRSFYPAVNECARTFQLSIARVLHSSENNYTIYERVPRDVTPTGRPLVERSHNLRLHF